MLLAAVLVVPLLGRDIMDVDEANTMINACWRHLGPCTPAEAIERRQWLEHGWGATLLFSQWGQAVGWSEFALRALSWLLGLLTIAWIYRLGRDLFGPDFLIERPLLQALRGGGDGPPVLLIDELDRTDEPFEAYLLEVLSDFQVTVPEIGPIRAAVPPAVIVTSNRTREIHDALKRRCFYHWVGYPDARRELDILRRKAPSAPADLSRQVVGYVQKVRELDLFKLPGIAETIDWVHALMQLDTVALDPAAVNDTLGVLLKYQDDIARMQGSEAERILNEVRVELAAAGAA